jgi:Tfp pilus assembly protein PilF
MALIEPLEKLLAGGQDNALLRFGLGNAYLQAGDADRAAQHLRAAVGHDPTYSAAWKLLGKALTDSGQLEAAVTAYEEGIRIATARGDVQAAKAMRVFLKRLRTSPPTA